MKLKEKREKEGKKRKRKKIIGKVMVELRRKLLKIDC